jgi:hypothetical protein
MDLIALIIAQASTSAIGDARVQRVALLVLGPS